MATEPTKTGALGASTLGLNKGMPIPEEDPRARAARRIAELEAHWGGELPPDVDISDKFYFDRKRIPDGWDYQWWPFQVLGKEDPSYWADVEGGGWAPVPLARHRDMMPDNWEGNTIDRHGQRLMERPMILTERSRARERRKANELVSDKEAQLAGTPPGQLQRQKSTGESMVSIKRSYEAIPIPK